MAIAIADSAKSTKRVVPYSAGIVILSLQPGQVKVGLVFNNASEEVKRISPEIFSRFVHHDRVVEVHEDGSAVVSFEQAAGFGTPFGKAEPEDEGDTVITALREGLEETGVDLSGRIFPQVSYREDPSAFSYYFNIVYLASGVGFQFNRPGMQDPCVDPKFSGMYPLLKLPYKKRFAGKDGKEDDGLPGIYFAAIRRIVAILLQLSRPENLPLLGELGGPKGVETDEIAWLILRRLSPYNFFSRRTLKMLAALGREDIVFKRMNFRGKTRDVAIAKVMGRNLIRELSGENMYRALDLLLEKYDSGSEERVGQFEQFLAQQIAKKMATQRSALELAVEARLGEAEEREEDANLAEMDEAVSDSMRPVEDYVRVWLAMDAEIRDTAPVDPEPEDDASEGGSGMQGKKWGKPEFFACVAEGRTCGGNSLPGQVVCVNHTGGEPVIQMPSKIFLRFHFASTSAYGKAVLAELVEAGVRIVERTKERQGEIETERLALQGGIRVFGPEDLGPNVNIHQAVFEIEASGYRLREIHILSLDKVTEFPDRIGDRTVVFCFAYDPEGKSANIPEVAKVLFERPFMSCRVYVNLRDADGLEVHAVELTAYQHKAHPRYSLKFAKALWSFGSAIQ